MELLLELIKVKMFGYFVTVLLVILALIEGHLRFADYVILTIFTLETIGVIKNYYDNHESMKHAWQSGEIKSRFEYFKKLFFNN